MNHGINNQNQLNIQQSQFTRNLLNNDPIQNTEEKTIVYAQTSLESYGIKEFKLNYAEAGGLRVRMLCRCIGNINKWTVCKAQSPTVYNFIVV